MSSEGKVVRKGIAEGDLSHNSLMQIPEKYMDVLCCFKRKLLPSGTPVGPEDYSELMDPISSEEWLGTHIGGTRGRVLLQGSLTSQLNKSQLCLRSTMRR